MLKGSECILIAHGTHNTTIAGYCMPLLACHVAAMGTRYAKKMNSFLCLSHFNINEVIKYCGNHFASASTCPTTINISC